MKAPSLACAIYTRKSSEEGLEQAFNSLDAQREACAAYIQSQKSTGWRALPETFDDGGFSGGTLQRPALQRLLDLVEQGRIQIIVVYKVDRLTRSLADFAKLIERFDRHSVSFVSVTQQFNTTTSMGRLTLNVLLSFAQFEREVTGERIRDKIAASKRKGLWMGGRAPVGYQAHERTLVIDPAQASVVQGIYRLYQQGGCVRQVQQALAMNPVHRLDPTSPPSRPFSRGHLYRILRNPIYVGDIAHKGQVHRGQHPAIIDRAQWEAVQRQLNAGGAAAKAPKQGAPGGSPLTGLLVHADGRRFTPSHAKKGGRRYRYYVCEAGPIRAGTAAEVIRLPASQLEDIVREAVCAFLQDESQLVPNWPHATVHQVRQRLEQARAIAAQINNEVAEAEAGRGSPAPQPPVKPEVSSESDSPDACLRRVVNRVVVAKQVLQLHLNLAVLIQEGEADLASPNHAFVRVPLIHHRRGNAVRMVVGGRDAAHTPTPDPTLIALLLKALRWFRALTREPGMSIGSLAKAEGVSPTYVSRLLHLAFLDPQLVMQIAQGRQPVSLTAERLTDRLPLPLDWGHTWDI